MKYFNCVRINNTYNKSINIVINNLSCKDYIVTHSTLKTLHLFFLENYVNSLALIGPFGSGKSSFLSFLDQLLNGNEECLEKLKQEKKILNQIKKELKKEKYFVIKITGEYISFKDKLRTIIINNYTSLKRTMNILPSESNYDIDKLVINIQEDIQELGYTKLVFLIDEFGKFLEYSMYNSTDVYDLQNLSEIANNSKNIKLVISLHKSIDDYISQFKNTEWDKIQGRFENIVFKDSIEEVIKILEKMIIPNTKLCKDIINTYQKEIETIINLSPLPLNSIFKKFFPFHPYVIFAMAYIFSTYFQNQRSLFSFLFSIEPFSFQDFVKRKYEKNTLYDLSNFFDYIDYLLKIYNLNNINIKKFYIGKKYINNIKDEIKQKIVKIITLLETFNLERIIQADLENIFLALYPKYEKLTIKEHIDTLKEENVIIYKYKNQSYSIIDESDINIEEEVNKNLSYIKTLDSIGLFKEYFQEEKILVKKFFIKTGSKKFFLQKFESENFLEEFHIYISFDINFKETSKKNNKSIFIKLSNKEKITEILEEKLAYELIINQKNKTISLLTKEIIYEKINDLNFMLQKLIEQNKKNIYFNGEKYIYSKKLLNELIFSIINKTYDKTPIINNYTFIHSDLKNGQLTLILKKLFNRLLNYSQKENLGFEKNKFPPEKAFYLSTTKASGIHVNLNGNYVLKEPDDNELKFFQVWKYLENILSQKVEVTYLIQKLSERPFGLDKKTSLLFLTLFIIVNKDKIALFRNNTFKFDLNEDILINIIKSPETHKIYYKQFNEYENILLKAYKEIISHNGKIEIKKILETIFLKFDMLPDYCKNTQKLSTKAKKLRSALLSAKDPFETLFINFPKALDYQRVKDSNINKYIKDFKNCFNEIVLSYKNVILELETFIAKQFLSNSEHFPYDDNIKNIMIKLDNMQLQDKEQLIVKSFINSQNIIDFINSVSIILINKKIENCFDKDIEILKDKIKIISQNLLSKADLISFHNKKAKKLNIISSNNKSFSKVVAIESDKISYINKLKEKIFKDIAFNSLSKEEKVYLLADIIEKELENE